MDGIALIKELRKLPAYTGVPIVLLTTESDAERKQEAKAAGATGWITKPFQPDQLLVRHQEGAGQVNTHPIPKKSSARRPRTSWCSSRRRCSIWNTTPDDSALIDTAFRALHTIKGSGAMFGFDAVAAFTHHVENAFDQVRQGDVRAEPGADRRRPPRPGSHAPPDRGSRLHADNAEGDAHPGAICARLSTRAAPMRQKSADCRPPRRRWQHGASACACRAT